MDLISVDGYTVEWRVKMIAAEVSSGSMASLLCAPELNKYWRLFLVEDGGTFRL